MAYELNGKGQVETANNLFVLNSEQFPSLGNVWDSLAESYLALSKKPEAKMCCTRTLELNPENQNARNMLIKVQ